MRKQLMIGSVVAALSSLAWIAAAEDRATVPYPESYRSWQHVKTMLIQPGHALENPFAGIHHVYANELAMQGMRTGKYPDGAVLVFDLLEVEEADKAVTEGKRKLVGVMRREAVAYGATGGWGFEGFAGDSDSERLVTDGGVSCFGCHTSAESTAYVFAEYRP